MNISNVPLIDAVVHPKCIVVAKADRGASGHYFCPKDVIRQPSSLTIV